MTSAWTWGPLLCCLQRHREDQGLCWGRRGWAIDWFTTFMPVWVPRWKVNPATNGILFCSVLAWLLDCADNSRGAGWLGGGGERQEQRCFSEEISTLLSLNHFFWLIPGIGVTKTKSSPYCWLLSKGFAVGRYEGTSDTVQSSKLAPKWSCIQNNNKRVPVSYRFKLTQ